MPPQGRGPSGLPAAAILGCAGPELGAEEAAFFRDADPWGFILFARNVVSPGQLRRLTGALRDAVGRDAPVLIDQEGGRVQRLRAPHWREWLPPLDHVLRVAPDRRARAAWLRYRLIAAELRSVGIDTNCAVTADIAGPATHPFLRNRCLGADPAAVIVAARAAAEGLLAGGVLPVVKHIPGHGRATADSHHDLPRVTADAAALAATDFAAFAGLADLPVAMTAHVVFTAIDPDSPATTSPAVIRLIRERIGFSGLLLTDDISMGALPGPLGARAAAALRAGCDIVLHCNGDMDEMKAVLAAAGRLGPAAAARAEAALACRRLPEDVDSGRLEAELEALLGAPIDG
ncbi:MAG: beta-hexosaminidase [Rhodobacteraceae bacterium]|nr:beta-hexosaminidase [Paracoccaceae bacterium]